MRVGELLHASGPIPSRGNWPAPDTAQRFYSVWDKSLRTINNDSGNSSGLISDAPSGIGKGSDSSSRLTGSTQSFGRVPGPSPIATQTSSSPDEEPKKKPAASVIAPSSTAPSGPLQGEGVPAAEKASPEEGTTTQTKYKGKGDQRGEQTQGPNEPGTTYQPNETDSTLPTSQSPVTPSGQKAKLSPKKGKRTPPSRRRKSKTKMSGRKEGDDDDDDVVGDVGTSPKKKSPNRKKKSRRRSSTDIPLAGLPGPPLIGPNDGTVGPGPSATTTITTTGPATAAAAMLSPTRGDDDNVMGESPDTSSQSGSLADAIPPPPPVNDASSEFLSPSEEDEAGPPETTAPQKTQSLAFVDGALVTTSDGRVIPLTPEQIFFRKQFARQKLRSGLSSSSSATGMSRFYSSTDTSASRLNHSTSTVRHQNTARRTMSQEDFYRMQSSLSSNVLMASSGASSSQGSQWQIGPSPPSSSSVIHTVPGPSRRNSTGGIGVTIGSNPDVAADGIGNGIYNNGNGYDSNYDNTATTALSSPGAGMQTGAALGQVQVSPQGLVQNLQTPGESLQPSGASGLRRPIPIRPGIPPTRPSRGNTFRPPTAIHEEHEFTPVSPRLSPHRTQADRDDLEHSSRLAHIPPRFPQNATGFPREQTFLESLKERPGYLMLLVLIIIVGSTATIVTILLTRSGSSGGNGGGAEPSGGGEEEPSVSPTSASMLGVGQVTNDKYPGLFGKQKRDDYLVPMTGISARTTPQDLAAAWLTTTDRVVLDRENGFQSVRWLQRYTLAVLFYGTNGPAGWRERQHWLNGDLHECDWDCERLLCHELPNGERVIVGIDIPNNRLEGTFPTELGNLQSLSEWRTDSLCLCVHMCVWSGKEGFSCCCFVSISISCSFLFSSRYASSAGRQSDCVGTFPHSFFLFFAFLLFCPVGSCVQHRWYCHTID